MHHSQTPELLDNCLGRSLEVEGSGAEFGYGLEAPLLEFDLNVHPRFPSVSNS